MEILRTFEAFAGYGSQLMALRRLEKQFPDKLKVEPVGIAEIDKYAIQAYQSVHGDVKNYGDISKIDWEKVPDFDLFTYSSPCFVAGTLIRTDKGQVPIEDIKVGDMVLTHKSRYQKVVKIGHKPHYRVYKIESEFFDTITCTGNHPFYAVKVDDKTYTPKWIEASKLSKDYLLGIPINLCDSLILAGAHFVLDDIAWIPFGEISVVDGMFTVYNLEVEEDHSYTANTVIVHNCQDFSQAGKQAGGEEGSGTRSSLLWECQKAITIKRPKYCLLENVSALVSEKFMPLFFRWFRTLEDLGYSSFWKVLNAKDYGVPQNRERVFLLSIRDDVKFPYYFPKPMKLEKRLKDILENNVDEKYYLKDVTIDFFMKNSEEQKAKGNGFRFNPTHGDGVGKAVTTHAGGRMDDNFIKEDEGSSEA